MQISLLLLFLPSLSLGFSSLSKSPSPLAKHVKPVQVLYSSPDDNLSPFDAYVEGESNKIVSKDEVTGEGDVAAELGDVLTVGLIGKVLKSGSQFVENENFVFELGAGDTFPGFNEGLIGSKAGTKRVIKVPPSQAYGKNGARGVPPMSDLIFEVEVQAVAHGAFDKVIAKIGLDRLAALILLGILFAVSPFLPS
eukprot:CAMPEP_0194200998 /NCGR_PEP_ID=MMETSP0156-20130528/1396_1 /TAXON_ID=33649 /ORGANISM="Thalassionema nitzschioides, Strain L26-B" /LENGTH=194 /DNA_ID=CAMNT_0038926083 /DNA_START=111 /DNA_END=695 /DNA_ORIENTATION=-